MTEETKQGVEVPADAPAGTKEPSSTVQPSPEVEKPGASSTDGKQVPLQALQEERGKRQDEQSRSQVLEAEVADLKRIVAESQQQQQQHILQQQQPQPDPKKELETLWEEDPRKAVQTEIMYAMDWRDRIDANLELQADSMSRKFSDFNNYRSAALGQVRSMPLNQRGGNGVLEAAYFYVRGQNADTMLQQRETELLEKYRRGEISAQGLATPPGSFTPPAPIEGTQLTAEQNAVAIAMGLTPEQYSSAIKNQV